MPIGPTIFMSATAPHTPLLFHPPNTLSLEPGSKSIFKIPSSALSRIICEINKSVGIELQFYCTKDNDWSSGSAKKTRATAKTRHGTHKWLLNKILYGPASMGEPVGNFLSQHQAYLQDPVSYDRVVVYRNPHAMPSLTEEYTEKSDRSPIALEIERLQIGHDLLALLMLDEPVLLETDPPESVKISLFR